MRRIPVTSSHIHSIGHDPSSNTLHVEFSNGTLYSYPNVGKIKFKNFLNAESKGSYLNDRIKPFHPGKRIA